MIWIPALDLYDITCYLDPQFFFNSFGRKLGLFHPWFTTNYQWGSNLGFLESVEPFKSIFLHKFLIDSLGSVSSWKVYWRPKLNFFTDLFRFGFNKPTQILSVRIPSVLDQFCNVSWDTQLQTIIYAPACVTVGYKNFIFSPSPCFFQPVLHFLERNSSNLLTFDHKTVFQYSRPVLPWASANFNIFFIFVLLMIDLFSIKTTNQSCLFESVMDCSIRDIQMIDFSKRLIRFSVSI